MAGIDIVLDHLFNNPNLDTIPLYGFYDDFERPDGPVGLTSREAKPWLEYTFTGGDAQALIESGQLKAVSGASGWRVFAPESLTANGTFKATLSSVDINGGVRLALRVADQSNFLMVRFVSGGILRVEKFIGAVATLVANSAVQANATNGVMEVVLNGTSVSVKWNGVEVIAPQVVTEMATNTKHGFMLRSGSPNTRVAVAEFVPA